MNQAIDLQGLPPELREQFENFRAGSTAYAEQQKRLVALDEEVARLRWKASTVLSTASNAETAYKALASKPGVDQTEISTEIDRVGKLRLEAQALTVTADVQAGMRGPCVVQLAELRYSIKSKPPLINNAYLANRLEQLLQRDDMREYLLEVFGVCNSSATEPWGFFVDSLKRMFGGAELNVVAPMLAALPRPVTGEVVINTPVEMLRLKKELI